MHFDAFFHRYQRADAEKAREEAQAEHAAAADALAAVRAYWAASVLFCSFSSLRSAPLRSMASAVLRSASSSIRSSRSLLALVEAEMSPERSVSNALNAARSVSIDVSFTRSGQASAAKYPPVATKRCCAAARKGSAWYPAVGLGTLEAAFADAGIASTPAEREALLEAAAESAHAEGLGGQALLVSRRRRQERGVEQ